MLSNGKYFQSPAKYTPTPLSTGLHVAINSNVDYTQYEEVLHYLNENNFTENLLERYLKVYQVIENFMLRNHVAKMVNNGTFNLREIRYIVKKIDVELDLLIKLFKSIDCISIVSNPISIIKDYFLNIAFPNSTEQDNIKVMLNSFQNELIKQPQININACTFADITYAIRNSIVHNKETEIHLTYSYLEKNDLFRKFLNDFMIPSLEYLCFLLLSDISDKNPIRYKPDALASIFADALKNQSAM